MEGRTHLSARIHELLWTNDSPLDYELAQLREIMAAHAERLSALSASHETVGLHQLPKHFKAERKRITREIAQLKKVTSPVRRLPGEVLSEIFLACVDENLLIRECLSDSLNMRRTPWILTVVCSRWRDVALSFQRLWSTITLQLDKKRDKDPDAVFLLNLHLERSGSHPLRIGLQILDTDTVVPEEFEHLILLLLPSSPRWNCAVFHLPLSLFHSFPPITSSLAALQALSIRILDLDLAEGELDLMSAFFAPNLRTLKCFNVDFPSEYTLPRGIIRYEWNSAHGPFFASRHLDVLRQTPNLEEVTLDCSMASIGDSGDAPLCLPKLRRLYVETYDQPYNLGGPCHNKLFRDIVVPALEDLRIDLWDKHAQTKCIFSLLDRSRCPLKTLTLDVAFLTGGELIQILELVPTLTTLDITVLQSWAGHGEGQGICDNVVARLTRQSGNAHYLVPFLSTLYMRSMNCDHTAFVEMIESRCQSPEYERLESGCANGAYLERLHISALVDFDDELSSRLDACVLNRLELWQRSDS